MGPRCDDDSGHGKGLFIYVPVVRWPTPPEDSESVNLHVALVVARRMDSWGETSLFGAGRYRSVLLCHTRRREPKRTQGERMFCPARILVAAVGFGRFGVGRRLYNFVPLRRFRYLALTYHWRS
ncbi:hypothetical protein QTP88_007644 [Uroleucon formosanum]